MGDLYDEVKELKENIDSAIAEGDILLEKFISVERYEDCQVLVNEMNDMRAKLREIYDMIKNGHVSPLAHNE